MKKALPLVFSTYTIFYILSIYRVLVCVLRLLYCIPLALYCTCIHCVNRAGIYTPLPPVESMSPFGRRPATACPCVHALFLCFYQDGQAQVSLLVTASKGVSTFPMISALSLLGTAHSLQRGDSYTPRQGSNLARISWHIRLI